MLSKMFSRFSRHHVHLILWGVVAGISSVPMLGSPLFFAAGISGFLYYSENADFSKTPLWSMGAFVFGYFLFSLHWIPLSLHVDWAHYFYLVPIALLGLPLFFALYYMIGTLCVPWQRYAGMPRLVLFIFMWTALELVRAEFLTGFPWASLGYMWTSCLPIAQLAVYVGPMG